MFIFCHQRQKTNQKNAAQGGEGLVQKKANMPHFSELQHPLPLKDPPHLRALPVAWISQSVKGNFISRPSNCSRDLFLNKAKKLVLRYVLGSTLFQYKCDSEGIFSLAKKA